MAKLLPTLFFICTAFGSSAQEERIDTDRPDQTETAGVVPKNFFQAEIGFNKENTHFSNYNLVYPTVLLKYGFKKIELRLETTWLSSYEQLIPRPKWTTGLEPVQIGIKALLATEKKVTPKTSLIAHLGIPSFSSRPFRRDHLAPSFRFAMQKTLSSYFQLGTNVGVEWDGFSSTPWWLYTFSPGFDFGRKWYGYVEIFGFVQRDASPENSVDAGIAYYITSNTRIDLSYGQGISAAAQDNYIAIGFSFRFNTRN